MTYRGHVVGPAGEHLAPSTITLEQMAEARAAELERINRAVADREAREAAACASREASQAELGAAELAEYRERASAAWLGSGGTWAEFADAWPEIKRRHLAEQAKTKMTARERLIEQTKREMLESGRYVRM